MKFAAHALGRPFVVAPQTIGPFTKPVSRRLAALSLRLSRIVASRDRMSTEAAHALGRADVIEASDVALRLPYDAPGPRAPGPVRVGINVSGLLMAGGYTQKNMFGLTLDYPALMRSIIADFRARSDGCEIHLVPHVITGRGDVEDDLAACALLAAEFPGTILAPAFTSPSEAKTYIATLD
ncbi:MAG: polysaccharide pyruvyl transferase family protein, partial [Paracoccaceae bacterium]